MRYVLQVIGDVETDDPDDFRQRVIDAVGDLDGIGDFEVDVDPTGDDEEGAR